MKRVENVVRYYALCNKLKDLVEKEAIDNNYGKAKDDMTVIVTKIIKM